MLKLDVPCCIYTLVGFRHRLHWLGLEKHLVWIKISVLVSTIMDGDDLTLPVKNSWFFIATEKRWKCLLVSSK